MSVWKYVSNITMVFDLVILNLEIYPKKIMKDLVIRCSCQHCNREKRGSISLIRNSFLL